MRRAAAWVASAALLASACGERRLDDGAWARTQALPEAEEGERWSPLWRCDAPPQAPVCEAMRAGELDEARVLCSSLLGDVETRLTAHRCHAWVELEAVRSIAGLEVRRASGEVEDEAARLERLVQQRQMLEAEHLGQALYHLDAAIALAPDLVGLYGHRAELSFRLDVLDDLVRDVRAVAERDPSPDTLRALHAYAHRYLERGQVEAAAAILDAIIAGAPRAALALADRGALLLESGRPASAIPLLDRALEVAPANTLARASRIQAALLLGDLEAARSHAAAGAPATALAVVVIAVDDAARALTLSGELEGEEQRLARAWAEAAADAGEAPARWAEHASRIAASDGDAALAFALRGAELGPRRAEPVLVQGDILRARGLHAQRVARLEAFLRGLGDAPVEGGADRAQMTLFLVSALLDAGQPEAALERLGDVNREDTVVRYFRGVAHARSGAADVARRELRAVMEAPDAGALKEAAAAELDALERRIREEGSL